MKNFATIIFFLIIVNLIDALSNVEYQFHFGNFISEYKRAYKTPEEKAFRFEIWKKNHDFIQKHNEEASAGRHTYWMKLNHLSDLVCFFFKLNLI